MQIAKNTFTDGLVMDLSPDITQNTCLTNALNATYVTMNGNELQLQNDMGNAKFGAQLPAGYIPIGTTQIGGVIYVVSFNPTTNKTQIGSFPSPQIQFTSSIDITESELGLNYFETNLQYKKIYNDVILQPGDKFVFYFPKEWLNRILFFYNSEYFEQNALLLATCGIIKYSVCTVTQEGKLIELQNLRNQYYLPEEDNGKPTEDDYNVYNSSISGNLALVLTKVFCYDTNLQVLATDTGEDTFNLQFTYTFASNDKFIPSYVEAQINDETFKLQYKYGNDQELPAQLTDTNCKWFRRQDFQLYKVSYSTSLEKSKFNNSLTLNVQPIKNLEKAQIQLAKQTKQIVDLTKLGTSTIELTTYKYNINVNQIIINFAYLAYLQADEVVTGISVNIYTSNNDEPIISQTFDTTDMSTYFMDIDMLKTGIKSNELYIVEFKFDITATDLQGTKTKHTESVPRWLITEPNLFNETAQDYNEETNVYYWISSKTETLKLGDDSINADYSNICSLSQNSNINIKETHQFKNANINTVYNFDSNVAHISFRNITPSDYVSSLLYSNLPEDYIINKNDRAIVTISDLQLTFNTKLNLSVYYNIKGSRTQQIISKKNIIEPLFMAYPSKYTNYGHIVLNNITKEQLDSGIFEKAISNQPNIASIRITVGTNNNNSSLTLGENNTYQTVKGVLVKGTIYGNTTDSCLLTDSTLMAGGNEVKVMDAITRNINVYIPNQDFTYYTLTNDYTVTHIDSLDINANITFIDLPSMFLVKVGNKPLDTAMTDFQFNGKKPKNIKINFIEDVTKTSDVVTKQSKLPVSNIDNYLSINAQTLLLSASDNIISLYDTYKSDTLYFINNNAPLLFNTTVKFDDIKCDGSKFSISQGNLSITNDGTVQLNEQQNNQDLGVTTVQTSICPYSNTAITHETTKTNN